MKKSLRTVAEGVFEIVLTVVGRPLPHGHRRLEIPLSVHHRPVLCECEPGEYAYTFRYELSGDGYAAGTLWDDSW